MNNNSLPLNVLWIWNCNENTIAKDFRFEEGGARHQVVGANFRAFNDKSEMKVALLGETNEVHFVEPDTRVFIDDIGLLEEIWEYWHKLGGAQNYKNVLAQTRPPEPQPEVVKDLVITSYSIPYTKLSELHMIMATHERTQQI